MERAHELNTCSFSLLLTQHLYILDPAKSRVAENLAPPRAQFRIASSAGFLSSIPNIGRVAEPHNARPQELFSIMLFTRITLIFGHWKNLGTTNCSHYTTPCHSTNYFPVFTSFLLRNFSFQVFSRSNSIYHCLFGNV